MNLNNQMYNSFNAMMKGYENNDVGTVENTAIHWLSGNPENPFNPNSQEYEIFFHMQRCYNIWHRGDVNGKLNKRKMVAWALKLCELKPKQPYTYINEEKLEKQQKKIEVKQKQEQSKEEIEEQSKIVLGVIPEEDKEKEEKRSWLKFLFPWRKEGE